MANGSPRKSPRLSCYLLACLLYALPLTAAPEDLKPGYEAFVRGDYDVAITCVTDFLRDNPGSAAGYLLRGLAHKGKGAYARAIDDYTEAIRLDPKGAAAYGNRGNAHLLMKQYDRAIADCTEAIRLDPTYPIAYANRGTAYARKKEDAKAAADYTEVIRLDPKLANAYSNLASIRATSPDDRVRDGKEAVAYATKACELSRWKCAGHVHTLAAAYAEAGDYAAAARWQRKAIELGFEDKEDAARRLRLYANGKPCRAE